VLKFLGAIKALQQAWDKAKDGDDNPHYRFNHTCKQLQAKYIALQRAPKEQQGEIALLKAKIQALKQEIVDTHLQAQVEDLVTTEEQVQTLEEVDISHHKRLSRIDWLGEGNKPTKFYFATHKAKLQRESMPLLLLEDSQSITEEAAILTEVTCNYTKQFAEPMLTQADVQRQMQAQDYLLRNTASKLSEADTCFLEEPPTLLEITEIVKMLHNDKSLGVHGLTAEVFKACWHFIQHDFLHMVLAYWETGELAYTIKEGIINLLPKKPDK
jgi:hypothetical protein